MQPIHVLSGLLMLACLSIHAVLATVAQPFPSSWTAVQLGMAFGQAGLLAGWLALGRGPLLVRLVTTLAALVLFSIWLAQPTRPAEPQWLALLALYVALVLVLLLALRLAGAAILIPGNDTHRHTVRPVGPCQFSLGQLLALTSAACLLLAAGGRMQFPWQHSGDVLLLLGGCTLVAVTAIWAVWGRAKWLLRAAGCLAAISAMVTVVGRADAPCCWWLLLVASSLTASVLGAGLVLQSGTSLRDAGSG